MMNDENFYKILMDNLYDGIYFVDRDRCITYWNKGAERITGYPSHEMVGTFCHMNKLRHVDENGTHLCHNGCPLSATIEDGESREAEVYLSHAEGHRVPALVRVSPIRNEEGIIIGAVEVFSNNSNAFKIKRRVRQLEHNILLDPLTHIGNRAYGELRINAALAEFKVNTEPFALLFLDLDHFKHINDAHGHNAGDKVLQNIANTLKNNLRNEDICARWGGEEFIILIADANEDILRSVANKLRILVAESKTEHLTDSIQVTASIGGTLARENDTLESLVARADTLMYKSKSAGRNQATIQ